jgi:nucleoside-diphosphate-sugar epimerase
MKRVLVTGGSGFIGRALSRRLADLGCDVYSAARGAASGDARERVHAVQADVLDRAAIGRAAEGVDAVFHLAGRVHALDEVGAPDALYQRENVEGTRNALDAAIAGKAARFVFFSSVKAMGEATAGCVDETAPAAPATAYGRSKLAAEQLVLDTARREGLHAVCLRLPLVYGPGNKGNLAQMVRAIDRERFPPFPKVPNRRSVVHVANVVDAAILAAESPAANGQCYIVTDGRPYSTRELYELICRGLGKRVPRWSVPLGALKAAARVGDVVGRVRGRRAMFDSDALEKLTGNAWYSSEKIEKELGFRPRVTFDEALPEMIAWYRSTSAIPAC